MKILFLCRYFFPHTGGVEKHVFELSKRLIQRGHEVCVITDKYTPKLDVRDEIQGIQIIRINVPKIRYIGLMSVWINLIRYFTLIASSDVVHCHDVFLWLLPYRMPLIYKQIFCTFHGYERYPLRCVDVLLRKLSEYLSNGNICVGEFMKKWYKTKPNIITYGAVDLERFSSKNCSQKYDAVFVGRLDEQTDILSYVQAVNLYKAKYLQNFDLLVVGDGRYREKISKHYKLTGFVGNPEKYIDLAPYAFVSRYLSILEAFSMKKLVFALYSNPIKKDYLLMTPFNKWIVTADSPKLLSEKIAYYIKHEKTVQRMKTEAYKWVSKYSWDNMVDNYIKLWRNE